MIFRDLFSTMAAVNVYQYEKFWGRANLDRNAHRKIHDEPLVIGRNSSVNISKLL